MSCVLVVDDSIMVRRQVGRLLTDAGYTVIEASDGLDALAQLAAQTDIGMVLLDVNMPNMGGLELLERLRQDLRLQKLPVVMLTTEGHPNLMRKAKSLGARGWVIKPFKADLLMTAVGHVLGPP